MSTTGGNSDIRPVPPATLLRNITMSIPGFTFQDAIINPLRPTVANGLTVTVVTSPAGVFSEHETTDTHTYGSTSGNNFLTIVANSGFVIDSLKVISLGGFSSLAQPRISGNASDDFVPVVVPEPSTFVLMLTGLAAGLIYGLFRGRRHLAMA